MKTVVCLPGRPPIWVQGHARHVAQRLSDHGRVMVVQLPSWHQDERVPGELQPGGVIGSAPSGYPIWSGGASAMFGARRRVSTVIMVIWNEANIGLAVVAAAAARARGERLMVNLVGAVEVSGRRAAALRTLIGLADTVIERDPAADDKVRTVLALCGGDERAAETVVRAFNGLSLETAPDWRLRLLIDGPDFIPPVAIRHPDRVEIVPTAPGTGEPSLQGASVVIAPFEGRWSHLVERAVHTGAAGILVGHPVARRIVQRGNGVLLASDDASAVLVALELATGAKDDAAVSVEDLRSAGSLVVDLALASA